jgi:hypothetical protein
VPRRAFPPLDLHPEVERVDRQALAEIEPVRALADDVGDQLQMPAPLAPGLVLQPVQQRLAVALGAFPRVGDQVVDAQEPAAIQHVQDAPPGHGPDRSILDEGREPVAVGGHQLPDPRDIGVAGEGGPQVRHDLERREDLGVGGGVVDHEQRRRWTLRHV